MFKQSLLNPNCFNKENKFVVYCSGVFLNDAYIRSILSAVNDQINFTLMNLPYINPYSAPRILTQGEKRACSEDVCNAGERQRFFPDH